MILEGNGGFDSQGGHVGGRKAVLKLGGVEKEVDLTRLKLVVGIHGWDVVIVVQAVRVADKAGGRRRRRRRLELKNLGNGNRKGIFT